MLMNYISFEKLREALRIFYRKFKYDCAETDDLIAILKQVVPDPDMDIENFVNMWTKRPGYPLITVHSDGTITQTRFSSNNSNDNSNNNSNNSENIWPIPIEILYSEKTDESNLNAPKSLKFLFKEEKKDISDIIKKSRWIKVNPGYKAFCRVYYEGDNLDKIIDAIKNKEIDEIDRWSVLDDSIAICESGLMSYGNVLKILSGYEDENSFLAATPIISFIQNCLLLFPSEKEKLQKFGRKILGGILKNIGIERETSSKSKMELGNQEKGQLGKMQLRGNLLLSLAFDCNDEEIIKY